MTLSTSQSLSHLPRERAAELLKISVRTLDRYIRRGFLRAERFDRNVFIPRPSFERYYQKQAKRGFLPPFSELRAGGGGVMTGQALQPSGEVEAESEVLGTHPAQRGAFGGPKAEEEFTSHERDYDLKPVSIYKSLYEELKEKHEEQQRRMEGAHYRVGQLEAQLKNMVPLLEVKQERKRFEAMDRQYKATLQEAKVRVVQTRRVAETERYNKAIYIALVYILLALQPVFWALGQR